MKKFTSWLGLLKRSKLVSGSLVLFLGSMIGSFGNYLYHLLMGRMLGPEKYGILSSLISLIYLLGVPVSTLNLAVVKNVSVLKSDKRAIGGFYSWITKKATFFALLIFLPALFLSPLIASSLKVDSSLLVVIILLSGLISVFASLNFGVLRGLLKFTQMAAVSVGTIVMKVILAVVLVYFGFGVFGAVSPFLVSGILGLIFSYIIISHFLGKANNNGKFREASSLVRYLIPIFLFNLAHTSLYSVDVILARRFLVSQQAGFYAALSTLGKVIFFATSPIVMVMFPLISEKHSNGGNYKKIFKLSFLSVFLMAVFVGGIYLLFPQLMVQLLFGSRYFPVIPHLKIFVFIFLFFSLSFLMVNYFLSIKKVKAVGFYLLSAAMQVVFISLFHRDLFQLAIVSLAVMIVLFISLVLYYFINEKKEKR